MPGDIPDELRGLGALAALALLLDPAADPAALECWQSVPCPGCGAAVQFRPRQKRNRCGWCRSRVRLAADATQV